MKFKSNRKIHPRLTPAALQIATMAQLYNFPANTDGTGQTIAIMSLGGCPTQAGIQSLMNYLKAPMIDFTLVLQPGTAPQPDGPNGADGENYLDIAVAGVLAPKAKFRMYLGENTEAGFNWCYQQAIADDCGVNTCSWGTDEANTGNPSMTAQHKVLQSGSRLGISYVAAAGDNGSSDGGGGLNIDCPGCYPDMMCIGGTRVEQSGGKLLSESVWNDGSQGGATGGGLSKRFPAPDYQAALMLAFLTMRGVPDFAANADPDSGYNIIVPNTDGTMSAPIQIGGTSAAAPLWAAFIARLNQALGRRVGFLSRKVYAAKGQGCNDITQGNNGAYSARVGFDLCTGWGSPNGAAMLAVA